MLQGLLIAAGACLALYVALAGVLVVLGRRADARAVAGFVPDCIVLLRRLTRDPRVARPRKLLLLVAVGYLALPIDLIPDFIPVAGQLDDAAVVAVVLRTLLRGAGPGLVREHWPGPSASLRLMLRLAGAPGAIAVAPGRPHGTVPPVAPTPRASERREPTEE